VKAPSDERSVWVGVAARVARAGAAPVRLMLAPARGLARSPRAGSAMRSGVERMSATAGGVFETEAERAVDAVLAGPLPEAVARSMVARHVGERVVNEVLGSADLEGIVAAATEDERTERIVQQVLATIVACLVYPIVGIIETMLYYDIRIRREGFDIEYLAAAAASPIEYPAAT